MTSTDPVGRLAAVAAEYVAWRGIETDDGMSESELTAVENRWGFRFGTDHREFLSRVLPHGGRWLDWRHDDPEEIESRLVWPLDGMLFDVEHDAFWPEEWGGKPDSPTRAQQIATEKFGGWTRLIPIYGHRYVAADSPAGAPVFSVYQTDVIFYGSNLLDYLVEEFGGRGEFAARYTPIVTSYPRNGYEPWVRIADGWGSVDRGAT